MRWLRALGEVARSGLSIEETRLEPLLALRTAAGVGLVIGAALWLASPPFAASAALGAFSAGTATFQRTWRPRKVIALGAGAGLALSTFVGYLAAGRLVTLLPLLAVWAFAAGMAWALGSTAGVVAATTVGSMLVTVTLPTSLGVALEHAGVIALGGVAQAVLILLFPVRRWGAHRDALADALAAVADYARRLQHDPAAPFDPEPLMTARDAAAVTPAQARTRPRALHGPRGLAERMVPVVAALADPDVGAPAAGPGRDRARELLDAAADVLDAAARSIRRGTPTEAPPRSTDVLRVDGQGEVLEGPARHTAEELVRLLAEALEVAEGVGAYDRASTSSGPASARFLVRPTMFRLLPVVVRAVRRELRRDSPVLRHAVRLAAVAPLGYLIASPLPVGHGYWAPVASVMVMRPDFHRTYARAVGRLAGTLVGVALATGMVRAIGPDAHLFGALAVVSAALSYTLLRTGYAYSQCFTAAYVVFLLGMGGHAWEQTVPERVVLTLIGGALAMLAYVVFPAWETPRLPGRLADWLAANGRYAAAVLRGYAEPTQKHRADLRRALLASREARAAWQEAYDRARQEPVRPRGLTSREAEDAQEALRGFDRATMLMESHLPAAGSRSVPEAERFAEALEADTAQAADDMREHRNPDWGRVAEALDTWEGAAEDRSPFLRRGAQLQKKALDNLATAVSRTPLERDVGSAREEQRVRAALASEGDGSTSARGGG
ncbi:MULTISPECIES: FUSC family protein [Streptomyces]|uniref:FUSC family protein n=1 Tax=Streptomyces TaxID=1883 RepID=UPI001CC99DBB|nr:MULTISPECIES: FUSC family protein [Streptomyces]MBZ6139514.1 FUSC family protein [Streptomyces olivaceus]MBZ6167074.1 FUSC family protein [Streptomyces olivaceus]MBZ6173663.1 FUSC family protein [Streptomyces olivaceus]MBZ6179840.1 FUSC family protein [Streptomyces olivaceus]MCM8554252.1 FUSC family protein [Streptomyces sp. STCH 565 A]